MRNLSHSRGEVVVDNKGNLLDVNTSRPYVRRDKDTSMENNQLDLERRCVEYSRSPAPELSHDRVSFLLNHLAMHR